MEEHYDVGLVGWWFASNYGSVLTYYALGKILEKMGLRAIMVRIPKLDGRDWEAETEQSVKFMEKYFPVTKPGKYEDMRECNQLCDTFMLGSDQLWVHSYNQQVGYTFWLEFADDDKRKIAYATSLGLDVYKGDKEDKEHVQSLLKRFDGISVREISGVDICRREFGVDAVRMLDPVFLCDRAFYDILADSAPNVRKEPFILCYILDPTDEKRQAIRILEQKWGIDSLVILDIKKFRQCRELWDGENIIAGVGIEEFVSYIRNCTFLFTDSHHGACFGMIYQKPFAAVANPRRGRTRFDSLFQVFEMKTLLLEEGKICEGLNEPGVLDYEKINAVMDEEKSKSLKWLKEALEGKYTTRKNAVTAHVEEKRCAGCSACAASCPKDAIRMEPDLYGYYVPKVDGERCIDCGVCVEACPVVKMPENANHAPEVWEFQTADADLLYRSSSGGIFSLLAENVLREGGAVYGAAWREDFTAAMIRIDAYDDIGKLRKSKYMQSYTGRELFRDVRAQLEGGREVLFSGLPCQITGLKKYLAKPYENLSLVGLLCGNAPSAMFFRKYLEDDVPGNLKEYEFRSKKKGWTADCVTLTLTSGEKILRRGGAQDEYQRLYHNHTMCPYHCEHCLYQSFPRQEDISIGDFWWIGRHDADIRAEDGVSAVLVNNDRGQALFARIGEEQTAVKRKAPVEWLNGNGNYKGNFAGKNRDLFYRKIVTCGFHEAADYALKPNHGEYRSVYRADNALLAYDRKNLGFHFDRNVWEEHTVDDCLTLRVKPGKSEVGRYACMSLNGELVKGRRYVLSLRFKIRSASEVVNFHIKDSGSSHYQVVASRNIKGSSAGERWMDVEQEFVPQSGIFDEFMIGASQVKGTDNYISFAYIHILEG